MKKQVLLFVLFAFLGLQIFAQTTISGTVTSTQDGLPIPGVTVRAKGFNNVGTITNIEGKYTLQIPADAKEVIFSFVGMKTIEVPVAGKSIVDAALESEDVALGDMVVTAYGAKSDKKNIGYSVQDVKGEEISKSQRDNFLNSLDGRIAGVQITASSGQPGASSLVTLRGVSSISGNNQPLFIVDGVPLDNSTFNTGNSVSAAVSGADMANRRLDFANRISDLNADDFESITVLKGPEAAALYGIDAASGAIVITTKKGKNGKGKIDYTNVFSFSDVYHYPERSSKYSRGYNGISDSTYRAFFGPAYPAGTQIYDNVDSYFGRGFSQTHNISFEGGNDKTTYRFSANVLNDQGIEQTAKNQRINLSVSGSSKITEQFSIDTKINYIRQNLDKVPRGTNGTYLSLMMWPSNDDASVYLTPTGTRRLIANNNLGSEGLESPWFSINKNRFYDRTNRVYGNIGVNYKLTSWLGLTARGGYDYSTMESHIKWHPESSIGYTSQGAVERNIYQVSVLNLNYFADVNKIIGDIKINARVGSDVLDKKTLNNSVRGEKFYVPDFDAINNTDRTTLLASTTISQRRTVSALGSASLEYKGFITFTGSYRNDWTSTLPKESRSFGYGSANFSFVFSELWKNDILSFGKLRAAWGQAGKDPGPYAITAALGAQSTTGGGFAYGFNGPNPEMKPEFSTSREIGLETKFLKNRISFEISYFNKDVKDQIITNLRKSYGGGFVLYNLNGGTFKSNGYEIQFGATPIKTANFEWTFSMNYFKYHSELTELPKGLTEYYNSDTWIYANVRNGMIVGSPTTTFTGFDWDRNAEGQVLINPTNGLPIKNTAAWKVIGDRNPNFTLGVTNQFNYKSFSLSFLLNFRKGGDVFNGTELYLWTNGLSKRSEDRDKYLIVPGVLKDGKENTANPTTNTIQVNPYSNNSYYSTYSEAEYIDKNVSWVKLSDITLNYAFPKTIISKIKFISNLSVFFTGTDLFFISNYSGVDPNVNANTAGTVGTGGGGIDFGQLPTPRSYKFGIKLSL